MRTLVTKFFCALILTWVLPLAHSAAPPLWLSEQPVPKSAELSDLHGVRFHVIKAHEPKLDGYHWLHGVGLGWHKGKLYATFGHNKGKENTAGEEARGRVSDDGGKTWGEVFTIDDDKADGLGVSHGVLVSHQGRLWAFQCSFYNKFEKCHTRAYTLDETTKSWEKKGIIIEGGFGPNQAPQKMADGNWIMAGRVRSLAKVMRGPAGIAISQGDNLMQWSQSEIPSPTALQMYGESSVIVDRSRVINIARHEIDKPVALVAVSEDYGRTWTETLPSNLPMASSKGYAGTLSTGQRFLVGTTTADTGRVRAPLTIAVGRAGENGFRKIFRIRGPEHQNAGESHPRAGFSYPYALEHEGHLYIGYSNTGGRSGNFNSGELAVIPVSGLRVD